MTTLARPRIDERRGEEPDGGEWWVAERLPSEPLRGLLQGYTDYLEAEPGPFRRRHEPHGYVTFILNFAEPLTVEMPETGVRVAAPAFVAGLHDTWAHTDSSGHARGLQINLAPMTARALFGVGAAELAGDVVDLRDLMGPAGTVLLERLEAAPSSAARFDLLDTAIEGALARAEEAPPLVEEAWRRIRSAHGAVSIGALAQGLGVDRKRLHAAFDEHVGLPPKTVARIFRFQRAISLVGGAPWPVIAAECGYYDQSHLIRDFRQFAGMTPRQFEHSRSGNGGTVDAIPERPSTASLEVA